MDLSKLSTSDKLVAGGGLLLFIASFLPWFGAGPFSGNGWDVGFLWAGLPALLGLAAAAAVLLKNNGTELPALPVPWGQAFLGAGALAAALVVLKLLLGYEICGGVGDFSSCVSLDRKWGMFVAALAAAAFAYGGFLKFQEDKGSSSSI